MRSSYETMLISIVQPVGVDGSPLEDVVEAH